jgi:hypothetical protein
VFRRLVSEVVEVKPSRVKVDLSALSMMDSVGLAARHPERAAEARRRQHHPEPAQRGREAPARDRRVRQTVRHRRGGVASSKVPTMSGQVAIAPPGVAAGRRLARAGQRRADGSGDCSGTMLGTDGFTVSACRAARATTAAGIVDALVSDFNQRVCHSPEDDLTVVSVRRRRHKADRPMPENHTADAALRAVVIP